MNNKILGTILLASLLVGLSAAQATNNTMSSNSLNMTVTQPQLNQTMNTSSNSSSVTQVNSTFNPVAIPMELIGGTYAWIYPGDLGIRSNTPFSCVIYLGNHIYFTLFGWNC